MTLRLSKIDELTCSDHYYLEPGVLCRFLYEYTARRGYTYSTSNQAIFNFKKPMKYRGSPQWHYKIKAIDGFAKDLAEILKGYNLSGCCIVPIPPSKTKTHPEYDDRVNQVLQKANQRMDGVLNICDLIIQTEDMEPDHLDEARRLDPRERALRYRIDSTSLLEEPSHFILFDDVLTTGSHFMAARKVLMDEYGDIEVSGLFLARTVRDAEFEFDEFFDI